MARRLAKWMGGNAGVKLRAALAPRLRRARSRGRWWLAAQLNRLPGCYCGKFTAPLPLVISDGKVMCEPCAAGFCGRASCRPGDGCQCPCGNPDHGAPAEAALPAHCELEGR